MELFTALHRSATVGGRGWRGFVLGTLALVGTIASAAKPIDVDALLKRPWLKLEMDGLVLVSDASEGQVREWARQVRTFRQALEVTCAIPGAGPDTRATVFLFKSDATLRPLLPLADGQPMRRSAAAFFGARLGHEIGAVSFSGSRLDARERLQHELTHWHLHKSPAPVPLWLQEGLAQIYELFVVDRGNIRLGQDRDYVREYVRISGNPSLTGLLNTTELDFSRAGFKHQRTDLFYAQSWALMHCLLFGPEGRGPSDVTRYLMALKAGASPERALQQGFGVTIEEAHARLEKHIRTPRWKFYEVPLARTQPVTETLVPLAGAELEMRLAALLASAGHRDAARPLIDRLLARNPEDPVAWEISALAQLEQGDLRDATIAALAKALRCGTRNPYVPLALGHVAIERSLQEETGRSAGELFAFALELRPGMPEAYEGAARLVLARAGEVSAVLKTMIADGLRRSPSSVELNFATAWIERADGQAAAAVARLTRVMQEHPELPVELRLHTQGVIAQFESAAAAKPAASGDGGGHPHERP